jgi:acyl-CoA synthetase (NDP forming)
MCQLSIIQKKRFVVLKKLIAYKNTWRTIQAYKSPRRRTAKPVVKPDYLQSLALLRSYKIPTVKTFKYATANLTRYKYPAVLKITGPDFLHKSDKGAVVTNLKTAAELKTAAKLLAQQNKSALRRAENYLIVQEQANKFQELILGFKRDDSFGPIMMVGFGGIYTEVFKEVKLTTNDLDFKRAQEIIADLRIYPILNGARGQKKYDIKSLARAFVDLTRLANEHPEIKELDINPFFVFNSGCSASDVRIIN